MKPIIAGNWKMNGLRASLGEVDRLGALFEGRAPDDRHIVICPPFTLIAGLAAHATRYGFKVGGQDCHAKATGAHTGDVSAEMLRDVGAEYAIVGHSERRTDHAESDAVVRAKAEAARRAGLVPIVCVGETEAERRAGRQNEIVARQIEASLPQGRGAIDVAYEPVWAIGTGVTPTAAEIAEMHAFIRQRIGGDARILYGGSVKPSNAAEILAIAHVNGALVGGASLKAEDFFAIIRAA